MMKLQLFLGFLGAYSSDNWKVSLVKKQLVSTTSTVIPHVGYGGFGWVISVACSQGINDMKVALYRGEELLNTSTLDHLGKCVLVPNGGTIDDYRVEIQKEPVR